MRRGLETDPNIYTKFLSGNVNWALALIRSQRSGEALDLLRPALDRRTNLLGDKHYMTAETRGFLAMALAAMGDRKPALAEFLRAVPILLTRSRQAETENLSPPARDQRLRHILGAYVSLLFDVSGTQTETDAGINASVRAFRVADAARNRVVQRALAASNARAAARDPDLARLVRREQDVQRQIAALYGLIADHINPPPDEQNSDIMHRLRERIDERRDERARLAEEIETRFPNYAELVNPKPATPQQARAHLHADEALIATYVGPDHVYAWAEPASGPITFTRTAYGKDELSFRVAVLRSALDPGASMLGDIPPFDLDTAYALYADLLAPLESSWKDARRLLLVADGPLGSLPFSLLPTALTALATGDNLVFAEYASEPWLARTHAVAVLPSVTSLVGLRTLPPADAGRLAFVGFGDPMFAAAQGTTQPIATEVPALDGWNRPLELRRAPDPSEWDSAQLGILPPLPDTADEILGIAHTLGADLDRDVFLGIEANEAQVAATDLERYKVVAFTTHGLQAGDLDGLAQPALALTAPEIAGIDGDGLLTLEEVLGLRLNADWVLLSACNTGAGEGAGAEAVSGLGRAFFYAGARALLVTNWPVHSVSVHLLTTALFRRQQANSTLARAEALRQAMLELIDGPGHKDPVTGRVLFSYAHPLFWAPFSLVGDGA